MEKQRLERCWRFRLPVFIAFMVLMTVVAFEIFKWRNLPTVPMTKEEKSIYELIRPR
jgi:hypothetical protein